MLLNTSLPYQSSPEIVAALSGAAPPEVKAEAEAAGSNGSAASDAMVSGGSAAAEDALLALRRAALTGALEKTPPPGSTVTAGQAEALKEEFWRGHVKVRDEGGPLTAVVKSGSQRKYCVAFSVPACRGYCD